MVCHFEERGCLGQWSVADTRHICVQLHHDRRKREAWTALPPRDGGLIAAVVSAAAQVLQAHPA